MFCSKYLKFLQCGLVPTIIAQKLWLCVNLFLVPVANKSGCLWKTQWDYGFLKCRILLSYLHDNLLKILNPSQSNLIRHDFIVVLSLKYELIKNFALL